MLERDPVTFCYHYRGLFVLVHLPDMAQLGFFKITNDVKRVAVTRANSGFPVSA